MEYVLIEMDACDSWLSFSLLSPLPPFCSLFLSLMYFVSLSFSLSLSLSLVVRPPRSPSCSRVRRHGQREENRRCRRTQSQPQHTFIAHSHSTHSQAPPSPSPYFAMFSTARHHHQWSYTKLASRAADLHGCARMFPDLQQRSVVPRP